MFRYCSKEHTQEEKITPNKNLWFGAQEELASFRSAVEGSKPVRLSYQCFVCTYILCNILLSVCHNLNCLFIFVILLLLQVLARVCLYACVSVFT